MLFYISFADDDGFRGATVVSANSAASALTEATARGLNPGGQAAILAVPPGIENAPDIAPLVNRLATKSEMIERGGKRQGDLSDDEQEKVQSYAAAIVCGGCN